MNDDKICPRAVKCPIYSGVLESKVILVQTYKSMYCENGNGGRDKCKRYQVIMRTGVCPPDLLPNSHISVDEIIEKMEQTE